MQVRWQRLTDLALRRRIARTLSVGLVLGLVTSVAAPNEMASSAITDPCPVKKIVYQGPLTGPEAEIGVNQSAAARIAYNEVIRNFTYPNYKVTFVQADDQGSASVAAPVAANMASDPCVLGVIGPAFSGAAKVSLPYYLAAGIPVITPSATKLTLPNYGSSIFHGVTKSSADYFADYAAQQNYQKPYIVVENNNTWLTVPAGIGKIGVRDDGNLISESLTAAVADGADAIFYAAYVYSTSTMNTLNGVAAYLKAQGSPAKIIFTDYVDQEYLKAQAPTQLNGSKILSFVMPSELYPTSFKTKFLNATGRTASLYTAEAYDATYMMMEGVRRGFNTKEKLNIFLDGTTFKGVTGDIKFNALGWRDFSKVPAFTLNFNLGASLVTPETGTAPNYDGDLSIAITDSSTVKNILNFKVIDYLGNSIDASVTNPDAPINQTVEYINETVGNYAITNGTVKLRFQTRVWEAGNRYAEVDISAANDSITSVSAVAGSVEQQGTTWIVKLPRPRFIVHFDEPISVENTYVMILPKGSNDLSEVISEGVIDGNNNFNINLELTQDVDLILTTPDRFSDYVLQDSVTVSSSSFTNESATATFTIAKANFKGTVTNNITGFTGATLQKKSGSNWISFENHWVSADTGGYRYKVDAGIYRFKLYITNDLDLGNRVGETFTAEFTLTGAGPFSIPTPDVGSANVTGQLAQAGRQNLSEAIYVYSAADTSTALYYTVSDTQGNFELLLTPGSYKLYIDDNEFHSELWTDCVVGDSGQCNIAVPSAIVSGHIYPENDLGTQSGIAVVLKSGNTQFLARTDAYGRFNFTTSSIVNGQYEIYVYLSEAEYEKSLTIGIYDSKTANIDFFYGGKITVASGQGPTNLSYILNPGGINFQGTVSGPLGPYRQKMILIFKVNNGVPLGYLKVVTNNQGFFSEKVPEGIYRVQAFEDYNGAGAGGGYSSDCIVSGTTVTTCDLTMLGPNASGSVTLNNNSYSITQLNFMKYESGGVVSSRVTVTPNSSGNYVAALTAGTWRTVVHYLDSGTARSAIGQPCVVSANETSTVCNINLSTNNLTVKIKSTSGSLMNSGAKISLVKYETTTVAADTFISTELESVLDARGEISLPVLDGEYSLVLAPVKPATSGVTSSLRFRVSNGVVGSFYKFDTTTVIATPANGVVTLQIPTPTISGYIYKPDGVTPLQDGMVILFQQSPVTIFGNVISDVRFNTNTTGTDGYFEIPFEIFPTGWQATVSIPADSRNFVAPDPQSFVLTSQSPTKILTFRAKQPNVSGVVRGLNGFSVNNNVHVLNWNETYKYWDKEFYQNKQTDANGAFTFFMSPGLYRIHAGYDAAAGGDSGFVDCLVVDTATVKTCNISLPELNVTGVVSGPGGISSNNYVEVQKLVSGVWQSANKSGRSVDSNGRFRFSLEVGTYRFLAGADMTVNAGQGYSGNCVITDTSTVVTCNITLVAPNVTGTLTVGGVRPSNFNVQLMPDWSVAGNTATNYQKTQRYANGQFSGGVEPGTYLAIAWLYSETTTVALPMGSCVVPASGATQCNAALPATNFVFTAAKPDGTIARNNYYVSITRLTSDKAPSICCIYPNSTTGVVPLSLIDGNYQLALQPFSPNSTNGLAQNYLFTVANGVVSNLRTSLSTTIIEPTSPGNYALQFRVAGFSGTLYAPDGTTPIAKARVQLNIGPSIEKINISSSAYTDSNGKFSFDLVQFAEKAENASYFVQAFAPSGTSTYAPSKVETITVTNSIGPSNYVIKLRAPNFTGTVSGPLGVAQNSYLDVRKILDSGEEQYLNLGLFTDASGKFSANFEPGRYRIRAAQDLTYAGGNAASSEICVVRADSATVCNVLLSTPNLVGTVKLGGVVQAYGSAQLITEDGRGIDAYSQITASGKYAFTVPAGKYLLTLYLSKSDKWVQGAECTVAESGSTTCDTNLPDSNFKFKLAKSNGTFITTSAYISVSKQFGTYPRGFCCTWVQNQKDGLFNYSLLDGAYTFVVQPSGLAPQDGGPQSYLVEVANGVVTSVKRKGSTTSLTATADVFTLGLSASSISGTVVAPDGSTPVPDANVAAYQNGSYWPTNYAYSSSSGYFAFNQLSDGSYEVIARAPKADSTKADSAPTQVTVTGGVGLDAIKLTLRTPNVTGVVRGPKGISPFNYVEIYKVDAKGGYSSLRQVENRPSNGEGVFAYRVDAGTYIFRAQSDLTGAGGLGGWSLPCVVPATGAVTCDIALSAPNFTFRMTESDRSTTVAGAYSWISYVYDGSKTASVKNFSPQIMWIKDSAAQQTNLEDGTWHLVLNPPSEKSTLSQTSYFITVAGGVVTKLVSNSGETFTAVSGVYSIPFDGVNLTGTIASGNETYRSWAEIIVQRQEGANFNWFISRGSSNGTYGFRVPEGTYRIEVRTYSDKNGKISAISRSEVCTVPNTGTVTCNVVLRDPNFIGLIATPTGENFSYANAYLQRQVGTNLIWDQSPSIYDNKFYAYLENGTYRAVVFPYSSYRSLYTERQYEIVVNSGTITSVKNLTTGETLTAAAGIFTLKLGTPSVTGTVRLPGTSTVGAENVQVIVTSVTGGGKKGWRTSTTSDSQGKFAMTLPDGIYGIQAIPMGGGFTYGKSVYETFTVTGGNIAAPLLLRLRNPNLTGQVITPGQNGVALANVNVAIYVDGEYFNGWTDTDGRFGVYVDNPTPNCPSRCSLTLSYYKSSEYTPKSYSISSIGNLGTKAIGGVNTRVSVLVPQAGNTTVANGFGSVSLQKIDSVTGAASWVTSIQTDALGQASLTLEEGFHYKIWAYPNSTYSSAFSVKVVDIPSFTVADDGAQTITFDRPNINFAVTTRTNGLPNARGWFEIRKDDGSGNYDLYLNNYLDGQGKGAALLSNGSYKITFWPGKVVASQITVDVSVSNGTASGGEITSGLATVLLPGGNISGYISNDSGTVIAGALVAAIPNGDASQAIMTKTDETGYYELTLNRSYAWEVKAMDPISTNVNSRTIAINALNSQAALSNQNIIVANAP